MSASPSTTPAAPHGISASPSDIPLPNPRGNASASTSTINVFHTTSSSAKIPLVQPNRYTRRTLWEDLTMKVDQQQTMRLPQVVMSMIIEEFMADRQPDESPIPLLQTCKVVKELGVHHLYKCVALHSATAYYSFLSKTPTLYLKHVRQIEFHPGNRTWRKDFADKGDKFIDLLERRIRRDLKDANRGKEGATLPQAILEFLDQHVIVKVVDRQLVGLKLFLIFRIQEIHFEGKNDPDWKWINNGSQVDVSSLRKVTAPLRTKFSQRFMAWVPDGTVHFTFSFHIEACRRRHYWSYTDASHREEYRIIFSSAKSKRTATIQFEGPRFDHMFCGDNRASVGHPKFILQPECPKGECTADRSAFQKDFELILRGAYPTVKNSSPLGDDDDVLTDDSEVLYNLGMVDDLW